MNENLLIVEDDPVLAKTLATTLQKRGFVTHTAPSLDVARAAVANTNFSYGLIDLKLGDGSGLDLVPVLRAANPHAKIVILTGYGNIASAVAAIKIGAVDYLAKPADADAIAQALRHAGVSLPPPAAQPMSADRVRWEHIWRVYQQCDQNISRTARQLNMHRRSLQRILQKYAPPESPSV
jgi:two-component system, response regulator RegA